jgi:DUF1680 family protein
VEAGEPRQAAFVVPAGELPLVYLMALQPGHFKTYSTPEDSFWCCVGTGMENHARYGEATFAR